MSSGSPRSRIDQFFTSRKKKPLSPYPTAEKANKDEKNSLEGSPSSKATLDNYLVTSHDDNFLVKCAFSDAVALSTHGSAHWSLTSEINLASEFTHKTFSPSPNLRTEEHPLKVEDTGEVQNGPCEILVVEETKKCNLGVEVDNAVDEDSRKETIGITSGGENLEHSQFAADFLSLYCGELSTGIRSSSEWNLKGQKRNGSPSLLIANSKTCKKKQCVSDSDHFESQVGHGYSPENLRSQPPDKLGKPGLCQPGELEETSCKEDKEYDSLHVESSAGLRECSKTPNCILGKAKFFTPGPPSNAKRSCGSSKWVSRSSNISPGDEFWVEAIQVADGLFAPIGGSVRVAEGLDVINGHCEPGNAHSVITANCSNKLLKDATSYTLIPQEAGTSSKSTDDGKEAELKESNVSDALIEKQPKENAKLPPIVLIGELSPLPVKRFDFLLEEKNLDKEAPQLFSLVNTTNITNGGSECSESISLTCKGNRTSGTLTPCDNAQTNRDGKLISSFPVSLSIIHDVPALGGTRGPHQLSEDASYLAVSKGSGVLMCQMRDVEIVESDKSLIPSPAILGNDGSAMSKEDTRGGLISYGKFDPDSTPSSSMPVKDSLQLSTWLPLEICSVYMKKGISKLYPWQVECLQVDGVLQKKNLVYCASTSAGKSFVAEILILRQAVSIGKMALLVLPYVSLCAEKAEHLEILLEPLGKHVRSFYGNQGGGTLPKDTSIAVCTIEKANFLINKLLEEGRLSEVGIVVIDELHMVGDQNRGYLLELMLTKLRYAAGEGNSGSCSSESSRTSSGKTDPAHGLQIVGMSATMPNVGSVAEWLKAALYQTDFRPVPLEEYIKVGNTVFNKKMEVVRTLPSSADLGGRDPDHVVELCNEVVQEGHSVLLFCSSRKGCETTARHVSNFLIGFSYIPRGDICEFSDASSAIEALRRCPAGLDPVLEETLPSGVAYHHAGLTVEEREIVEFCYRRGIVRVLTATSTLAAGVNLPARRVIFRQPRIGRDFIDGTRYRQMAGRAGRTGIDTRGESILICKPEEVKRIAALLNDSCPPLQSCLSEDKNGMTHAILEVVAGGIVQTASDIHRYVRCTLLNSTKPFQDVVKSAQDSLRWLCHRKFIEWNEETKLYSATSLGRASFGSSLSPEESLVVLDDLSRAREAFVLASDLHLVYLVTPINVDVEPDWELYYERFMELSALDQSVGNLVGVVEPFLMRMAHGAPMPTVVKSRGNRKGKDNRPQYQLVATNKSSLSDEQMVRVCRRFYVALMLLRLVQEVPVADVCEAFKVARGMVQALQENAGRFALMVTLFCERLGWHDLEGLVSKFQNRVSFGVRAEIAELTNIPYVKGSRARALYKAGFRTPLAIAEASLPEVVKALFESSSWAGQGTSQRLIQFGVAKKIKNGARKIVLDQAEEARAAAFSAFKSLGVLVPHFSRPLPPTSIGDDIKKGSGSPCSGEDTPTSSLNVNVRIRSAATTLGSDFAESKQDIQLYTKQVVDDTNKQPDDFGLVIRGECLTRKTDIGLGAAGKEISTGSTGELVEGSTQISGPEINISKTENSGASICPKLQNSGNCDAMLSRDLLSETLERTNDREPIPKHNTSMISEKGPVNASNTPGGFDSFLNLCDRAKEFYFDVHFSRVSDLNCPVPFEIHGLALCWENSPVYYINLPKDLVSSDGMNLSKKRCDFGHTESDDKGKDVVPNKWPELAKHRWNRIAKIMGQMGVRKVTWNLKCQIQVLQKAGISIQRVSGVDFDQKDQNDIQLIGNSFYLLPPVFVQNGIDMCLVAWILWPDEESRSSPNLEKEVKKRLSGEAAAAANRDSRWKNQMRRAAHNGCCRRVAQTRALDSVLWKLLVSENMVEAFVSIESPLVKVLADMELWGIGVDMEGCLKARHLLGRKLKELEKEACTLAGVTFSLSSTADIANILYRHLKLPILEGCNKGKHHLSTDKHCLDLLRHQHPIVPVIKEHRTLSKLLNTTLGSICSRARLCMQSQKYKICGHWLQTSTATGRLSMEEPNLQCVEHTVDLRIHHDDKGNSGSVDEVLHRINARDFFIPTRENWVLLTADYSQIELRLMAHFSKDSSLIELLSMPDGDVFIMIAARWTGKLQFAVSSQERDQTKRLVYGILYGMGANTLAEQLGCSSDEAAEKIQSFKSSFPGVSSWLHEAVEFCRQKGYVETLKGRKRFLSKIKCGNSKEKAKAQRQAVNSICQGSAADIIKIAMIKIHSVIVEGWEMRNSETTPAIQFSMLKGRCRILLQVHDELVVEVDPSVIREGGALLQTSMENAVSLRGGKDMGLLSALPDGCSKRAAFINYEEEGKEDFHSIFFDSIEKQRLHTLAAVGYSLLILESTVNGTYLQGLNTSLDCI